MDEKQFEPFTHEKIKKNYVRRKIPSARVKPNRRYIVWWSLECDNFTKEMNEYRKQNKKSNSIVENPTHNAFVI